MTSLEYATFSDNAITAATIVVALAFLAHILEWGFARQVEKAEATVGGDSGDGSDADVSAQPEPAARVDLFGRVGVALTVVTVLVLIAGVITRTLAIERAPWGNMYEYSTTGAALLLLGYLAFYKKASLGWLGLPLTGFTLVWLGFAMTVYVPAGPLVPSLQSPWLVIHVAAVLLASLFFTLGGILAAAYLVKERVGERGLLRRLPSLETLDALAFRVIAVSFPLWTFGALIAGPIWAQYSWSRYWAWDPKEVWSLITWIVYAGYLHARLTAGWKGRRAAYLALLGFATFLFNYYGVNLLFGNSIHSYAQ